MKTQDAKKKILALLVCSAIMVVVTSFQDSPKTTPTVPYALVDTPKKKSVHIEIDMKDLDKAMEEINIKLKEIDWDKISKEVTASLNSIDMEKIKKEITSSIENVDLDKIKTEVNNSIKNIDFGKIEIDIKNATDEIKTNLNSEEFKKNMKNLPKIDKEKLHKELKKAQEELEKNKEQIKKKMEKAKEELDNETLLLTPLTKETTYKIYDTEMPEKNRLFFLI